MKELKSQNVMVDILDFLVTKGYKKEDFPFIAIVGTKPKDVDWTVWFTEEDKDIHDLTLTFMKSFIKKYADHHNADKVMKLKEFIKKLK